MQTNAQFSIIWYVLAKHLLKFAILRLYVYLLIPNPLLFDLIYIYIYPCRLNAIHQGNHHYFHTRIFSHREKYFIGPLCRDWPFGSSVLYNNRRTMNNNTILTLTRHLANRIVSYIGILYVIYIYIFMHTITPFQFSTGTTLSLFLASFGNSTIVRRALRFLLYTYTLLFSLFSFIYICSYVTYIIFIRERLCIIYIVFNTLYMRIQ